MNVSQSPAKQNVLKMAQKPSENKWNWLCRCLSFFPTVSKSQNSKFRGSTFTKRPLRISDRNPTAPVSLPCSELIPLLEKYFLMLANCRRGFTATNKAFLRSKLMKYVDAKSDKDPRVNLKRLSEKEEGCSFTFFEWFIGFVKVVNEHLRTYWEEGVIIGFVDRLATQDLLRKIADDGAFVVRFSQSKLSSVTVSYVLKMDAEEGVTGSLEPVTYDQLKSLSLFEILNGRIYHCQTRKGFTNVYFHDGNEKLTRKHKSIAFPPLLNKEKAGKPSVPNRFGCWNYDQVLVIANPVDAEAGENIHRDFGQCL